MSATRYALIIFKLFIFIESNAQLHSPLFTHYTTATGLPSSEIYYVIQDYKGCIWLGTDRGITKFDGYDFKTYTYKDGLTDNTVFKILEDGKKKLWLMTYSGRIFYIENDKVIPYNYNSQIAKVSASRVPNSFFVDSLSNVYMTFQSAGGITINKSGELKWTHREKKPGKLNYLLEEISDDVLLTSACLPLPGFNSVNIIHSNKNKADTIKIKTPFAERFLAVKMKDGTLLFTLGNSLYSKNKNSEVKKLYSFPVNVLAIMKDKQDKIWFGTEKGVYVFRQDNFNEPVETYLYKSAVTSILQDKEGGYWITTLDNGVFYTPGYGIRTIEFSGELTQKPISLTSDFENTVYAGCWSGALVKITNKKVSVIHSPPDISEIFPVLNLSSIYPEKKIYLSRTYPCYFQDERFIPYKIKIKLGVKTNFIKAADGNIYCGGSSFIMKINGDSMIPVNYLLQRINCMAAIDSENGILIGTNRGVYKYDILKNNFEIFRNELSDLRVDDIKWMEDKLFFATKGKGVMLLYKDSLINIDENSGICSDLTNKLLVDGNVLWCTTNKGVSKITIQNPDTLKYSIVNITSNDGLLSDEIHDITLLNKNIYLASNNGISYFDSNIDFINQTKPEIALTSLQVSNISYPVNEPVKLSHEKNDIKIRYNGISYRSREKILYRYLLINNNDTVTSTTMNREVEFLSLPAGNYKFSVSAMNSSGIWSPVAAAIGFIIKPVWWQTWWFRILFLGLVLFTAWLFYRNRVKKLKYDFEVERRQASLQLTAMRAQMNPHFIFNVMNSIRNYIQNHDIKSADKYLTSFSKLVRYTLDNSQVQEISLEEELTALKNYMELEKERFENGFDYNITCEEDTDLENTKILSMLLQPFVENSIKHGISRMTSGGKIIIDIRKKNAGIIITVEDNGIGIKAAESWNDLHRENHISHGTSLIFERIKAYNKLYNNKIRTRMINLNDNEGNASGTRVEIEIAG
jgi:hypothetical protein